MFREATRVNHARCGMTIMMLKHRPRAGDVLMVADILWPPDYIDGDPIMCMICQEPVHPDHLLVSAGVEVPV